ncbi:hypothetical protein [Massilia sp. TSP1-1-2]|uniref:hypothetical protein n=1 Tax=Massilia sp. TSP1-1-2 TaxID=2804649 RepID=UPI003CF4B499
MSEKIKLVAGDTRPQLVFSITDDNTKLPIDLSNAATVVVLKFRQVGSTEVKATMACGKLAGKLNGDGTVDYTAPYNGLGVGGRAYMNWSATALDTEGEYEGEIEITFEDGGKQTIFEALKFKVRSQY